jgi:hypothetical protein
MHMISILLGLPRALIRKVPCSDAGPAYKTCALCMIFTKNEALLRTRVSKKPQGRRLHTQVCHHCLVRVYSV